MSTSSFGFATDALDDFDNKDGALRTMLMLATRHASHRVLHANEDIWRPALDCGELKLRFVIAPPDGSTQDHARHARELEKPILCQMVVPSPSGWPRAGTLGKIEPHHLELFSLSAQGNFMMLRVRETTGRIRKCDLPSATKNTILATSEYFKSRIGL